MIDRLGCVLRFTNLRGHHFHSVIVDFHSPSGQYGVLADNDTSNVTVWMRIDQVPSGAKLEVLPGDTPVRWRSEKLLNLMETGEIARLVEETDSGYLLKWLSDSSKA